MSVLSERDIIEYLGKEILIYPFNKDHLIGCCLWLTASEYAYSIKNKALLNIQTDTQSQKKFFTMPKQDTILVWTNESVSLSPFFCGTIHSKVGLVAKRIGHIGTKVNPNWSGILALSLHNLSDEDIPIYVDDTIAYLRFYKLGSKSDSPPDHDSSARLDIIPGNTPVELLTWITDRENLWRKGNKEDMKKKLLQSPDYEEAINAIDRQSWKHQTGLIMKKWAAPIAVSLLILLYLLVNQKKSSSELIVAIIPVVYTVVAESTKTSKL